MTALEQREGVPISLHRTQPPLPSSAPSPLYITSSPTAFLVSLRLPSSPLSPFKSRVSSSPFHTGDALHQREGFLLFRVNGENRLGVAYRLLVILVMMTIGLLAGLSPLFGAPGTPLAVGQALAVMAIQLSMSLVCFWHVDHLFQPSLATSLTRNP